MAPDQTDSRVDLAWETLLDLEADDGPLVERLEHALRDAVSTGRLPAGAALPASRRLAESLGVSRWAVTETYGRLVAEGVLEARVGSGTRVPSSARPVAPRRRPATRSAARPGAVPGATAPSGTLPPTAPRPGHDLRPGVPDLRHVPRDAWVRATREALAAASNDDLAGAPAAGHPAARTTVAAHLRRARLVDAPDTAVVLTRGATDATARLAAALHAAGHRHLLVEDPSWPVLRDVARRAGLEPVPVPVDAGGVDVDALVAASARTGARVALLTPAHQFPTGVPLSGERREQVLAWARSVDGLVVEDDYDAEFRYDRRPVAALQRLDPERVVLVGSVSKTLSPAVGVGWVVLPVAWRAAFADVPGGGPSVLDQLTFARLVAGGGYDRHLRAARGRYRRRHDALAAALDEVLPQVRLTGLAAGLHVLAHLPASAPDAAEVVRAAARLDVGLVDLRRYQCRPAATSRALVLGYGNLADARLAAAVARLAACAGPAGA
ncbi:GntR family transcriptional regulator/MocR family aminotransferase [Isoptericola jiangsuensis]|uniref:GntR family transcriptional regulator/MocR family aminotransferase n=1 Tax=Isoptericola jiangsuensis TaxID=548579 RepID=A0A2A9F0B2_9MICO|nr:PLP-dependent aminotransferase family protein [Isoptericola jiangsuensis]PFG44423.1 GntR family transcriptional regulator/MocR family aminotransferase [Isoptericola jiangsuensis]